MSEPQPRVLLVDDEPNLLDGLRRVLRSRFHVVTATSGDEGLHLLSGDDVFAVVVSDFQMPAMNGAEFLTHARALQPDATRVLLTGQADISGAAAVVNGGGISRLLLKPVPADELITTLAAAAEQHRLVHAERVLLEQTLAGSVKAMSDLLALACPAAFARATRMRALVAQLFAHVDDELPWHVSVAVTLSQIGAITLPPDVLERFNSGATLPREEAAMVARLPAVAEQILADIPRLDAVRDAIRLQHSAPAQAPLGARVLRLVHDYDLFESSGRSVGEAIQELNARADRYDPVLLAALVHALADFGDRVVLHVPLSDLRVGMTLADDVFTASGVKLVPRGHPVSTSLLQRIVNFAEVAPGVIEPICVFAPRDVAAPTLPRRVA
jgi:response regulator RpfG family c-di-GMP phosphodiesterase